MGWSEPAATNALVEDEAVVVVAFFLLQCSKEGDEPSFFCCSAVKKVTNLPFFVAAQ